MGSGANCSACMDDIIGTDSGRSRFLYPGGQGVSIGMFPIFVRLNQGILEQRKTKEGREKKPWNLRTGG